MRERRKKVEYLFRQAVPLTQCFLGIGQSILKSKGKIELQALFHPIGRHVTGREFTPAECEYFVGYLQEKKFPWWGLPASFFRLPQSFERRIYRTSALERHHAARLKLVREFLPPAPIILDIGGASDTQLEGSLLAMGYPHRPKEVWIVDLPIEQRIYTNPVVNPEHFTTEAGTEIRYVYSKMTKLSFLGIGKFDLVWSGQSIEHITEQESETLLKEVLQVLKPGGYFCLDTPNRKLTKLLCGKEFIHPEHKIEYTPDQLVEKVRAAGFEVEKVLAVTPMPISLRHERFCKLEAIREVEVTEEADTGLSFFIKCRKP